MHTVDEGGLIARQIERGARNILRLADAALLCGDRRVRNIDAKRL